ncbi:MAG: TetR/AcrR family transcriptional regulator [Spirochaetota bacterium]
MGVSERREREKNIRRDSAIAAAMKIYKQEGYYAVTMDKIAENSELSRAALYIYFKSKDEIFINAIVAYYDFFAEQLQKVYDNREIYKNELLEKLWECFQAYYERDPDVFHLNYFFHQDEVIRHLPEYLRVKLHQTGSRVAKIQHAIIAYGVDNGIFIKTDPRTLAEVIFTSALGILHFERSKNIIHGKTHLKITSDLALKVLLRGIRNNPNNNIF